MLTNPMSYLERTRYKVAELIVSQIDSVPLERQEDAISRLKAVLGRESGLWNTEDWDGMPDFHRHVFYKTTDALKIAEAIIREYSKTPDPAPRCFHPYA